LHDLLGDAIRFSFIGIAGVAHRELCLTARAAAAAGARGLSLKDRTYDWKWRDLPGGGKLRRSWLLASEGSLGLILDG
jgi:hypothetical protein